MGAAAAGPLLIVSDEAAALQSGCSDADPISRGGDPGGQGRNCQGRPRTGCSDGDPSDPGGSGRNCTPGAHGCSDSDPSDPSGRGQRCGNANNGNDGAYATGRRERRYQVCWVDHPNRSNDECNMQTYSEWAITYSDERAVVPRQAAGPPSPDGAVANSTAVAMPPGGSAGCLCVGGLWKISVAMLLLGRRELVEERLPLRADHADVEHVRLLDRGGAVARPLLLVLDQLEQRARERIDVAIRHEDPVLPGA